MTLERRRGGNLLTSEEGQRVLTSRLVRFTAEKNSTQYLFHRQVGPRAGLGDLERRKISHPDGIQAPDHPAHILVPLQNYANPVYLSVEWYINLCFRKLWSCIW